MMAIADKVQTAILEEIDFQIRTMLDPDGGLSAKKVAELLGYITEREDAILGQGATE